MIFDLEAPEYGEVRMFMTPRQALERMGDEFEPVLHRAEQLPVSRIYRYRRVCDARALNSCAAEHAETEVDMKIAQHRQHQNRRAGARFDSRDRSRDLHRIGRRDDEPDVVGVFALVGVIDAGLRDDGRRGRL